LREIITKIQSLENKKFIKDLEYPLPKLKEDVNVLLNDYIEYRLLPDIEIMKEGSFHLFERKN
jgi:hypothetical protein